MEEVKLDLENNKLYRVSFTLDEDIFLYFGSNDKEDIKDFIKYKIQDMLDNNEFDIGLQEITSLAQITKYDRGCTIYTNDGLDYSLKYLINEIEEYNRKKKITEELESKQLKLDL